MIASAKLNEDGTDLDEFSQTMVWLSIILAFNVILHYFTFRNLYCISSQTFEVQTKVLGVANLVQGVLAVFVDSQVAWMVNEFLGGDWSEFFQLVGYVTVLNACCPVLMFVFQYRKFLRDRKNDERNDETEL